MCSLSEVPVVSPDQATKLLRKKNILDILRIVLASEHPQHNISVCHNTRTTLSDIEQWIQGEYHYSIMLEKEPTRKHEQFHVIVSVFLQLFSFCFMKVTYLEGSPYLETFNYTFIILIYFISTKTSSKTITLFNCLFILLHFILYTLDEIK